MEDANEFGERVKFKVGDKVKVWKVFKNPVGSVEKVTIDPEKKPIFYSVKYTYPDTGTEYTEEFESSDLTLHEKEAMLYQRKCECGGEASGGWHSHWCPKRG